ncbi:MAG: hypothetical protein M0D55_17740 [Elusimicrobiota bacterium]|nr:MAG: hypothetical protein M0D55_17740 [Elusimicrobiota bacterium]
MAILLTAVPVFAATTPLEADFPDGYWDREVGIFGGRSATTYNISLAVEDPAKTRAVIESVLRAAEGKLTSFSDQTAVNQMSGADYGGMARMRPAYNLGYLLPEVKSGPAARKLLGLGRLISYNAQSPFKNPQMKELDERIDWIEKEMKSSAGALKSMPVSRALLDAKLKRLKAIRDGARATLGFASVTVQIMREDPESDANPARATLVP